MLRIYIIGVTILFAAIVLNIVVQKLGILGWYDFLAKLQQGGMKTFSAMRMLDYIWLFLGYPFLLGLAYLLGDKCYAFFMR